MILGIDDSTTSLSQSCKPAPIIQQDASSSRHLPLHPTPSGDWEAGQLVCEATSSEVDERNQEDVEEVVVSAEGQSCLQVHQVYKAGVSQGRRNLAVRMLSAWLFYGWRSRL